MSWDDMLPDSVAQQIFNMAESRNPELGGPVRRLKFMGYIVKLDDFGNWGFDQHYGVYGITVFDETDVPSATPRKKGSDHGMVGQAAYADELGGVALDPGETMDAPPDYPDALPARNDAGVPAVQGGDM